MVNSNLNKLLILGSFLALSALALEGEVVSGNITDAKMELETLNDSMASLQMDFIIQMDKTDASVETTTTPTTTTPTTTTPTTTTPTTTTPTTTTPTTTTPTTTTTTTTTSTSTTASICPRNDGEIELKPSTASMSSLYRDGNKAEHCIDKKEVGGRESWLCVTEKEEAPWFAIDYGYKVSVGKVILGNSGDHNGVCKDGNLIECYERTANVEVRLSDELPADGNRMFKGGDLLATWAGPGTNNEIIEIESEKGWENILGRYLIIQMDKTGNPDLLNLQEVTGYGKECD